ncbi:MAG: hypothetical protein VW258_06835 [Thalassolituus sp.]
MKIQSLSLASALSSAVALSSAFVFSSAANAYEDHRNMKFTSYTFKHSTWTEDQYVGDLKEVVNFADAVAHAVEFRTPENAKFKLNVGAAVRSDANGDTELESLLGAVEAGGVFIRMETSSAPGYIAPEEGSIFDNKYVAGERGFTAKYLQVNIGKSLDHWPAARWGLGYIHVQQPGTLNMYTTSSDGGYSGMPNYPDAIIDPEYQHDLLGIWLDVDNLQAAMHDGDGFMLAMNRKGGFRYGWGLTMDMIFGALKSHSSQDLDKIVKDNYGLDLEYNDPFGIGWSITYRLEFITAYRMPSSNFGLSFGLEGRAFQGFYSEDFFGTSLSVDDGSEAALQLGPGDNMVFQYGPFVRLAWEM